MKLNVLGVKRIIGKSKANGSPFDMCRLLASVPIDVGGTDKFQVTGYGSELAEVNLDPACLPSFAGVKFPCVMDLTTDSRPFRGKFETVVTGFLAATVATAKAA